MVQMRMLHRKNFNNFDAPLTVIYTIIESNILFLDQIPVK